MLSVSAPYLEHIFTLFFSKVLAFAFMMISCSKWGIFVNPELTSLTFEHNRLDFPMSQKLTLNGQSNTDQSWDGRLVEWPMTLSMRFPT